MSCYIIYHIYIISYLFYSILYHIVSYRVILYYIMLYYIIYYIIIILWVHCRICGPSLTETSLMRRITVCSLWLEEAFRWLIQHTLPLVFLTETFIHSLFFLSHLIAAIWPSQVTDNTHNADRFYVALIRFLANHYILILISSVRILLASENFYFILDSKFFVVWRVIVGQSYVSLKWIYSRASSQQ